MRVEVRPQMRAEVPNVWSLDVDGDTLILCGEAVDLSGVAEGGDVRDAHPLVVRATRRGGEVQALVIRPIPVGTRMDVSLPFPGDSEAETAAVLAEWRTGASLARADFALAALAAGLITAEEAEAWAAGQALPAVVATALDGIADPTERTAARIRAIASANVHRTHPLIALIATHMGLTDAQVDALFQSGQV